MSIIALGSPATIALALAALSVSAAVFPRAVAAGLVPDAGQMAVLRYAAANVRLIRMRGDFGTRWGARPSFDSSGVRLGEEFGGPHRSMRMAAPESEVAPIPWLAISSIETDRGTLGRNAVVGGLIGALVGSVIALSRVNFFSLENQQHRADTILAVSTGSGVVLGALTGWRGNKRTIYPPSSGKRH